MRKIKRMCVIAIICVLCMISFVGCNYNSIASDHQSIKVNALSTSEGNGFSFILNKDGRVIASGYNEYAQLGLGHTEPITSPQIIPFDKKIRIIEAGNYTSYAVDEENNLYTWGNSIHDFDIDADNPNPNLLPTKIDFNEEIKALSTLANHLLILTSQSEVYAYGLNNRGCLGTGNTDNAVEYPVKVDLPGKAIQIATGGQHSVALLENGDVYIWGSNEFGQLGNGGSEDATAPMKVDIAHKIMTICANDSNTYLLTENGELFSCGLNQYGQTGTGDTDVIINHFKQVPIDSKIKLINAAVMGNAYAVNASNQFYVWGDNGNNAITKEDTAFSNSPLAYDFGQKIEFLSKGGSLFMNDNGRLYCWGYNGNNQLFISSEKVVYEPILIEKIIIQK